MRTAPAPTATRMTPPCAVRTRVSTGACVTAVRRWRGHRGAIHLLHSNATYIQTESYLETFTLCLHERKRVSLYVPRPAGGAAPDWGPCSQCSSAAAPLECCAAGRRTAARLPGTQARRLTVATRELPAAQAWLSAGRLHSARGSNPRSLGYGRSAWIHLRDASTLPPCG